MFQWLSLVVPAKDRTTLHSALICSLKISAQNYPPFTENPHCSADECFWKNSQWVVQSSLNLWYLDFAFWDWDYFKCQRIVHKHQFETPKKRTIWKLCLQWLFDAFNTIIFIVIFNVSACLIAAFSHCSLLAKAYNVLPGGAECH